MRETSLMRPGPVRETSPRPAERRAPVRRTIRQAEYSHARWTEAWGPVTTKLLQVFYANAIPLDLLKAEQDRITAVEQTAKGQLEVTEEELAGWQDVLGMAIRLAGNCHAAYLKARPSVRRRFNEAVLEAAYVKDRMLTRAEFSEVFAPLSLAQVRIRR